jgi:hypothetical protein
VSDARRVEQPVRGNLRGDARVAPELESAHYLRRRLLWQGGPGLVFTGPTSFRRKERRGVVSGTRPLDIQESRCHRVPPAPVAPIAMTSLPLLFTVLVTASTVSEGRLRPG